MLLWFFFNDTATTEIYTLSLHDALPISPGCSSSFEASAIGPPTLPIRRPVRSSTSPSPPGTPRTSSWVPSPFRSTGTVDRKSTRLNSSHANISYAVFCLKKKKTHHHHSP